MRLKRGEPEPDTRVGNCCGCNVFPLPLFKIPGIYRYRCGPCFLRETGYRHMYDSAPTTTKRKP